MYSLSSHRFSYKKYLSQSFGLTSSDVDEPEWSGTLFRYLLFSQNACSGTYC